jgi:ribonuclease R
VQGHRDGHGFVVRDDGERDIYLPPNEMRAVLHKDRVRCASFGMIAAAARKAGGGDRGASSQPIIGLLQESGVWLVAPEDKRYGQDVLIPKATGAAKPGQVVVVELTEPPALLGSPWAHHRSAGRGDDPGMEIEIAVRKYGVPHIF